MTGSVMSVGSPQLLITTQGSLSMMGPSWLWSGVTTVQAQARLLLSSSSSSDPLTATLTGSLVCSGQCLLEGPGTRVSLLGPHASLAVQQGTSASLNLTMGSTLLLNQTAVLQTLPPPSPALSGIPAQLNLDGEGTVLVLDGWSTWNASYPLHVLLSQRAGVLLLPQSCPVTIASLVSQTSGASFLMQGPDGSSPECHPVSPSIGLVSIQSPDSTFLFAGSTPAPHKVCAPPPQFFVCSSWWWRYMFCLVPHTLRPCACIAFFTMVILPWTVIS